MTEEKDPFCLEWQELSLQEVLSENFSANENADVLRAMLLNVECARAGGILEPSASDKVIGHLYRKYADLVDSSLEVGGLNNYAESVLSLVEGRRNESQQWTSSLTTANLEAMNCVQSLRCTTRTRLEDQENKQFKSTVCDGQSSRKPTTFDSEIALRNKPAALNEQCLNQAAGTQPPHAVTRRSDTIGMRPQHADPRQSNNQQPSSLQTPATHLQKAPASSNDTAHSQAPHSCDQYPSAPLPSTASFWTLGQNAAKAHTSAPRPQHHQSVFTKSDLQPPLRAQHPVTDVTKPVDDRQLDTGLDNSNDDMTRALCANSFRTARQQLVIDHQKRFGRERDDPQKSGGGRDDPQKSGGGRDDPQMAYGSNKKSLGTRRGLNSKFVPPVMSKDGSGPAADDGGTLVRKAGVNKSPSVGQEEPVDERLKNIDPKMIELIMSEIMDHGAAVTWEDIAGLEFAKKTIKEIVVWPMLRPDIFTGLRGPPKGLLLFGPPGTGKTLIGKCIASQSKSTFFSISASSLTSKWVGEGEKMVRALFAVARVHQPAVVFMDEIDSLLSQRSDTEHESSRRIKTEFLVQLDGATSGESDRILLVGATNRPQEIDEAARRRFVKRLYIPLPENVARQQIVNNLLNEQNRRLSKDEMTQIVQRSDGYSGADVANLCREAALGPIRSVPFEQIEHITAEQVRPILYEDFDAAFKQVRASVSEKDLELYIGWNKQYGSWGI